MTKAVSPNEHAFMRALLLALGAQPWCTVWRQNSGGVLVRDARGRVQRRFNAGPPPGVGDLSGFVRPEGWRIEIEVKAERGRLRPSQKRFAAHAGANGVVHAQVKYDSALTPSQNVERAVAIVRNAVAARRSRQAHRAA